MNLRTNSKPIGERRLMTLTEAAAYCSLGKNSFRKWAGEIGAIRHFGRRVLCDREIIDKAISAMEQEQ